VMLFKIMNLRNLWINQADANNSSEFQKKGQCTFSM
jgi:hypothetical protein